VKEMIMRRKPSKMARLGKISEMGRSFDIEFWQRQSHTARMAALWEMTVFYHHKIQKRSLDELRLDQTVGGLTPREW